MSPRNSLIFQGLLEAAIPVYGFFAWKWDISFILLFYLIDWLLAFGLTIAKGSKRIRFSSDTVERTILSRSVVAGFLLMCGGIFLFALAVIFLLPGLNWSQRTIDFLVYEEWGIQQGLLLIPLIVLNGIVLYKQQFIKPELFRKLKMQEITAPFVTQNLLLFAFGGLLTGLFYLVQPSEMIVVFTIIGLITIYRMVYIRQVISYTIR